MLDTIVNWVRRGACRALSLRMPMDKPEGNYFGIIMHVPVTKDLMLDKPTMIRIFGTALQAPTDNMVVGPNTMIEYELSPNWVNAPAPRPGMITALDRQHLH